MGQCGCGDFSGDLTFPGPNGDVYVLDVYPGCEDCDAAAGVVLYRFTPEEAERWGVAHARPLAVTQDGIGVPVVDGSVLRRLVAKEAVAGTAELVKEIIADGFRNHFRDAASKTFAEWNKRAARDPNGRDR